MTSAKINGIDVHYQAFGEGETIVFAHGAGGNLLSWWQQIPYFSQNYRCITIDQRGFGHSLDDPNGPGSGAFVEDLVGLLDYLEIGSAHLVAQSMGGRTMLGFAVAYPHRTKSLVMADTVGGMAVPEVEELQARLRDTNAANVSNGTRRWPIYTCRSPIPIHPAPNRLEVSSPAPVWHSLAICKCPPRSLSARKTRSLLPQ